MNKPSEIHNWLKELSEKGELQKLANGPMVIFWTDKKNKVHQCRLKLRDGVIIASCGWFIRQKVKFSM